MFIYLLALIILSIISFIASARILKSYTEHSSPLHIFAGTMISVICTASIIYMISNSYTQHSYKTIIQILFVSLIIPFIVTGIFGLIKNITKKQVVTNYIIGGYFSVWLLPVGYMLLWEPLNNWLPNTQE